VLPTPVRNDGVSRYIAPAGDVAHAAIPNMVPVYEAQRSHRQASQSSGVLQMQESPGDLENPLVSRRVGHYGRSVTSRGGDHRRFHQRLGSCLQRERRERALVCDKGRVSHKYVVLALQHFRPRLSGQHVLVRTDNTATLAYINRQGGVRSPSLHHWATRLLLWAARHVLSLRGSYTRSPQLRCGPVIERLASSSRLVPSPTSDRSDLGAFFQGAGGRVREQAEHLLPALVLARGRRSPTRHRHAGPPVASST